MAALQIRREETGGIITLHLSGTFDGTTARELNGLLEGLDAREVVLDFTQVRAFADAAVAVASRSMTQRPVRLYGLDRHRERVFRYFGVEVPLPPERAYGAAEEAALKR
jgi:anti-anti-sigma regulatory factor